MLTSIVIPSLVRESLYPLVADLLDQAHDGPFEIVIVAQPYGRLERARLPADPRIAVHEAPTGLGIGRYRQLGAAHARGDVLAWIDDDERPRDTHWLARLTTPIHGGDERVVTAGCHIPLGRGYVADAISWLGLPGGGYPGFETMWPVDARGYTDHLCTGNFAIARETLVAVGGFDAALTSGNEDTDLADRLRAAGVPLRYAPGATVMHEARTSVIDFARWHVERGRAHRQFLARASRDRGAKVAGRLRSSLAIIARAARTRYLPGVLVLTGLQYACQAAGFMPRVRLVERLVTRVRALLPAPDRIECTMRGGYRIVLNPNADRLERRLYAARTYEPATLALFDAVLRADDTMVDVGANLGLMTIHAATRVGPGGRVVAVEPHPGLHRRLVENIALNALSNVDAVRVAAGESDAEATLFEVPEVNIGRSSLIVPDVPHRAAAKVAVEPLDSILARLGAGPVRLLKLDVEGFELRVLRGAAALLAARPIICMEVSDALPRGGDAPLAAHDAVLATGVYAAYAFASGKGRASPLTPVRDRASLALRRDDNLVYVPHALRDALPAALFAR